MMSGHRSLANEPTSFAEMPKSCQQIPLEHLTFELPLSVGKLTSDQQKKIKDIIEGSRTQACIFQMQYDGLLQQVIAILFEKNDVTTEQLKSFYDQLVSLSQNKIENKLRTVLSIRQVLSEKEWQDLVAAYLHFSDIRNKYTEQRTDLQQSYDSLLSGNNPSEFVSTPIMPLSVCIEKNPKIQILEQLILNLPLTNSQAGNIRNLMRLQERENDVAKQDISIFTGQFLQLLTQQVDQLHTKKDKAVFNQLVSKEYLLEIYSIQKLTSLFQMLTPEQKTQLREKYMIIKSVL